MGEVEKKPEAVAADDKKEGAGGGDGKNEGGAATAPPPPPPEEVVMRVYMHCEDCARKVRRSLEGFVGVEEVRMDCLAHKVVVKGKKAAEDPMRVVERVQLVAGRKVELLTPLPPPPPPKLEKEAEEKKEEKPKPEEKKEEPPVIAVVLKVNMHCEACAQAIKKRILKMKGVEAAAPNLKASEVTVTGAFDPAKLVEHVCKRAGKHAAVVKAEPVEKKKPEDEANGEKKAEDESKEGKADGEKEKKDGGAAAGGGDKVVELKRYPAEYAYPPQIFSDDNPNACIVM